MRKFLTQIALGAMISTGVMAAPVLAQQVTPQQPAVSPSGSINWKILNLSPAQYKKINELRMEYSKKAVKLKADIQVKQLDIQQLLVAPSHNPSQLSKLLQEKLALEGQLSKATLDSLVAIKSLLTPSQIALWPKAVGIIK